MDNADTLAKTLWDYQRLHQKLEKVDCIIVFGGRDIRTAQRGAELFLQGYAPFIVMTGGYGRKTKEWDKSEAEIFAEIAIKLGVPSEKIILEKESTNTGDNIIFTKKLLRDLGLNPKKILAVQKPYTERRLLAAIQRQWPEVEPIIASPDLSFEQYLDSPITKEDCINAMVGDIQKLLIYPAKGFQVPVEIPSHILEAHQQLIRLGFDKML